MIYSHFGSNQLWQVSLCVFVYSLVFVCQCFCLNPHPQLECLHQDIWLEASTNMPCSRTRKFSFVATFKRGVDLKDHPSRGEGTISANDVCKLTLSGTMPHLRSYVVQLVVTGDFDVKNAPTNVTTMMWRELKFMEAAIPSQPS